MAREPRPGCRHLDLPAPFPEDLKVLPTAADLPVARFHPSFSIGPDTIVRQYPSAAARERSFPGSAVLRSVARTATVVAVNTGQIGVLLGQVFMATVRLQVSFRSVISQLYIMGVQSIPIVMVAAILAGIVTSQQGGYQFQSTIPAYVLGSVVTASVVLELGPVLTAIVLVGRVGARITAELGTMKVSEQMDAFHALGRDPIAVLAAPRILAGLLAVPILVAMANLMGVLSGMYAARLTIGLGYETFLYGARLFWHSWDLLYSMMKAVAFGFLIPVISVHMGLQTAQGAAGVGKQTTNAVMFMTVSILVVDALFPPLFLQ